MRNNRILTFGLVLVLVISAFSMTFAQDEAEIVNEEGGAVTVTGELTYTLGFFADLWLEPNILLYDLTWAVTDDYEYTPTLESQTLGRVTSPLTESPVSYEITLPPTPQGVLHDVDNDGEEDAGVQVFTLGIIQNLWGDPYMDERDEFLFGYTSAVFDTGPNFADIIGGAVLVWAPDDEQSFPSAFGDDGVLFTDDDPSAPLPAGWTTVYLEEDAFVFDRSTAPSVALPEEAGNEQDDFSELSYTEAWDATIEKYSREYAFTDLKGVDWAAIDAELRPAIVEAEENEDALLFRRTLNEMAFMIPDGHMFGPFLVEDFQFDTSGGLGMAIRDVDDGRVIVNFLTPEGPAELAGIELGAEIVAIDGLTVDEAIAETFVWSGPFSTPWVERLQALRYVVRMPLDTEVEVTFINPDGEEETVTLVATGERESFSASSFNQGLEGTELPVEFRVLDSGYGYIKVYSFSDNLPLTTELWERALTTLTAQGVPGIILDMRQNGGGFTEVGYQMMSFFFDEEHVIEISGAYAESIEDFYIYEEVPGTFSLPPEDQRYSGPLAVLIAPSCGSACEYVVRSLTIEDRAVMIGQYPTQGIGGGWQPFFLPEGEQLPAISYPTYDEDLNVIIEGTGVEPDVVVPVTEETLFSEDDVILLAAEDYLNELTALETVDGGEVAIGDEVTGDISERTRVQYTLNVTEGDRFNVFVTDESGELDTVVRIYIGSADTDPVIVNDDFDDTTVNSGVEDIEIPQDFTLIVEVGTFEDASAGTYTLTIENFNEEE